MSADIKDLYLKHREGQDKYTYFQLAAAAAALGFAVQKTESMSLEWIMAPLGLAAICWAGSFFCGCKTITSVQTALSANVALLQLKSGSHPAQPPDNEALTGAMSGVNEAIAYKATRAYHYAAWQFRLLVTGGLLFIGWHVLQMYCRTYVCQFS